MQTTRFEKTRRSTGAGSRFAAMLVAGHMAAMVLVGCGPATEPAPTSQPEQQAQGLGSAELASTNGISANGISANGITAEAVQTADFSHWFQADPEANDVFMQYVVRCALAEGQSISYTDPASRQSYTWEGLLGLTPKWAQGKKIQKDEKQVLTACLAAHANKYGVHISISVLGRDAKNQAIGYTQAELATYSRREGCFFGNVFDGEGIYAGSDSDYLDPSESTARACGLTSGPDAMSNECPPFIHIGSCASVCELDKTGLFYTSCTLNGRKYQPITTRLQPKDVYTCGDGVCQNITERCGTGTTADSCLADCGRCQ